MDVVAQLAGGFAAALSPTNLLMAAVGALLGTLVGVLPGLGPTAAIAILFPLTTVLAPVPAIIMLAGIYYGAMYGGSTTAILLNIPGEVASVPTCLDGYPMARQGRGGVALGIAAIGSFFAGTLGVIALTFFAPVLADEALRFGPPEYFGLMLLAFTVVASEAQAMVQAGKVRLLAVLSPSRIKYIKDVPTAEELGVIKGVRVQWWAAVAFPASTPDPIVKKWEAALAEMAKDSQFLAGADRLSMNIDYLSGEQTRAFVEKEIAGYTEMATQIGIRR